MIAPQTQPRILAVAAPSLALLNKKLNDALKQGYVPMFDTLKAPDSPDKLDPAQPFLLLLEFMGKEIGLSSLQLAHEPGFEAAAQNMNNLMQAGWIRFQGCKITPSFGMYFFIGKQSKILTGNQPQMGMA